MKKLYTALASLILCSNCLNALAQTGPEITSWIINTSGATGYNGIESNVLQVQYSDDSVYVSCNSVPGYDIGPWPGNPNQPQAQGFVYRLTRNPLPNTGAPVNTPLGHIGIWTNGVSMFNAKDAFSYNNQGVWNQNAIFNEAHTFDECLGHPAPNGEYHHHLNPTCLYDDTDSTHHSPIIGWSLDGYPVYGAYGFSNPSDASSSIKRMESSYHLRNIAERTTLPNGTVASQAGPPVNNDFPLGKYIEDFEFINGSGDLDEHNGRFTKTPEYPNGIYAYFVTVDHTLTAVYPYTLGLTYYGLVPPGNTGPNGAHNNITEQTTTYFVGIDEVTKAIDVTVYPNPVSNYVNIYVSPSFNNNLTASLYDATGRILKQQRNMQPAVDYMFDMTNYTDGVYFLRLQTGDKTTVKRLVKS